MCGGWRAEKRQPSGPLALQPRKPCRGLRSDILYNDTRCSICFRQCRHVQAPSARHRECPMECCYTSSGDPVSVRVPTRAAQQDSAVVVHLCLTIGAFHFLPPSWSHGHKTYTCTPCTPAKERG